MEISKSAWKNSLVKTLNAMYLICSVNSEWYTVQTLSTNNAGEASRMIRFTSSSQYSVQYRCGTNTAFFQSIEIVFFTVGLSFQRVERFSLQINLTYKATKAAYMENFVHRWASSSLSFNLATALRANAVYITVFTVICHSLD